jgi:hypothetical protein
VGIGCFIWNIELVTCVAALLKTLRPDIRIILGGPEISYETEAQEIFRYADHVICGEGEVVFRELCEELIFHHRGSETGRVKQENNQTTPLCLCGEKIIHAESVAMDKLKLPYDLYDDEDLAHRAIYVEASRGCPFRCDYCMSSLDAEVRYFPEEALFSAFSGLLDRGARIFRFVDRTFNINIPFALKILAFFRDRYEPGMMIHFEMIPDRMPEELLKAVRDCPPGMLQFEIGIQTFNEEVARRIQRPLDIAVIEANMRRLREETGVHIHADLIAGLPGEGMESFEKGLNRLLALRPQEIQLGILKRLRGAPIQRHTEQWKMVYSPHAPYEILQTSHLSFGQLQRIRRCARYWDLTVNNGHFIHTAPLIWQDTPSPFAAFMEWSDWLYEQTGTTANLHMLRLARLLMEYLTEQKGLDEAAVAASLLHDYRRGNRPDVPGFLKKADRKVNADTDRQPADSSPSLPRQQRHRN